MKRRLSHLLVPCVCSCLLVLGSVSSAAGAGEAPAAGVQVAQIRAFLTAEVQANRLPGLAFGLVHNTQIVSLQSFGEASEGHPVTASTPFLLDSLTKSFTALAVMQEVEAGHLVLDAPVQRYLPWFRLADPAASAQITVRQFLTMSSGLPAASPPITTTETMEQFIRSLSTVAPDRPVGSSFEYAPSGYVILGLLVQTVSGQAYGSYLEQHILAPLQMTDSFVSLQAAEEHGLAQGHQWLFGVPVPADDVALHQPATLPSGGLFSSVADMTHYLVAELNGGRYGSALVLSPSGIATMHTPAVPNPTTGYPFGPDTFYGMGWHLGTIADVPTLWHDGVSVAYLLKVNYQGILLRIKTTDPFPPRSPSTLRMAATTMLGAPVNYPQWFLAFVRV